MSDLKETKLNSEPIYDGVVLHVYKDTVELPDHQPAIRELIRHVGAVAIVAVNDRNELIMEHQFRYPLNQVITEIPAGKLNDKKEDRLEAAKREFLEETGYTAENWIYLGDYVPSPAYTDECISLYLAKNLIEGNQKLDEDEFLDVFFLPMEDAIEQVLDGRIIDGKTIAGILKANFLLNKEENR